MDKKCGTRRVSLAFSFTFLTNSHVCKYLREWGFFGSYFYFLLPFFCDIVRLYRNSFTLLPIQFTHRVNITSTKRVELLCAVFQSIMHCIRFLPIPQYVNHVVYLFILPYMYCLQPCVILPNCMYIYNLYCKLYNP